jgi:hypothetical protein
LRLSPDRARLSSAIAAFVGLRSLPALLLLLAGLLLARLLLLLLAGLALAGFALLELVAGPFVLEADVLALLGLELHAAIAFGLVSTALRLRLLVFALGLAALHRIALALLFLLAAAGAGVLVLLLARVLLLAFVPVLIGHGFLLSIRDGAVERLTLGRAVYPVR